ncbi:hypothetical protein Pan241w_11170 [Gimesia alba]|uniref:Uncharacterized protein n=1 Tax=Gimesia alba TaxID=2527973 RepID=A0A517RB12_9PLAN|nr:hypothetical protein [Gimesia alba]QDT41058.1 hypothetical protein Pan241w_11170 [Gimesia alba]
MASILYYGSHQHADNEVTVHISRRAMENSTGFVYGSIETWSVTGVLQADTLTALKTAMDQFEAAYREPNRDLIWKIGDKVVHQMLNDDTAYGVRVVVPPHFPRGDAPGELVNRRSYAFVVEAAFLLPASASTADNIYVVNYESNLSYTGTGGTTFGHLPTLTGLHQKQVLTETSLVTAQQTGMKSGIGFYPEPDAPFPHLADYEKTDRRNIRQGNPRRFNNTQFEFPIYWTYTFERNQPFPAAT